MVFTGNSKLLLLIHKENDHAILTWITQKNPKREKETLLGCTIKSTWSLVSLLLLAVKKIPGHMDLDCAKLVSNVAKKPLKLIQHFHSQQSNLVGKPFADFNRPLSEIETKRIERHKVITADKAFLKTSYLIAFQTNKTKSWKRIIKALHLRSCTRGFE